MCLLNWLSIVRFGRIRRQYDFMFVTSTSKESFYEIDEFPRGLIPCLLCECEL